MAPVSTPEISCTLAVNVIAFTSALLTSRTRTALEAAALPSSSTTVHSTERRRGATSTRPYVLGMATTSIALFFVIFAVAPFAAMYLFPRFLAPFALVPLGGERRIAVSENAASALGRQ